MQYAVTEEYLDALARAAAVATKGAAARKDVTVGGQPGGVLTVQDRIADGRSPTAAGRSLARVQFLLLAALAEALIATGKAGQVVSGRLLVASLRAATRAFGRFVVGRALDHAIEEVRLAVRREVRAANGSSPVATPWPAVEGSADAGGFYPGEELGDLLMPDEEGETGARRLFGIVGQEPVVERARSRRQGR